MKMRNRRGLMNPNFLHNKFVTLRNNKEIYSENTNSNFYSDLIFPIEANECSQVALTDFIYTKDISIDLGV